MKVNEKTISKIIRQVIAEAKFGSGTNPYEYSFNFKPDNTIAAALGVDWDGPGALYDYALENAEYDPDQAEYLKYLNSIADKPANFNYNFETSSGLMYEVSFDIGGYFYPSRSAEFPLFFYDLAFTVVTGEEKSKMGYTELTGELDFRVFSTIIAIVKDFIETKSELQIKNVMEPNKPLMLGYQPTTSKRDRVYMQLLLRNLPKNATTVLGNEKYPDHFGSYNIVLISLPSV